MRIPSHNLAKHLTHLTIVTLSATVQSHLQHYTEPQAQSAAGQSGSADGVTAGPTFSQTYQNYSDTILPLSTGVLTHNKWVMASAVHIV
jgi:hypothetical protein